MSYRRSSWTKLVLAVGVCLNPGCDERSGTRDPMVGESSLALESVPLDLTCRGPTIELTDVGDDLRDLWQGREAADTGKRLLKYPRITLTFDRPVDLDYLEQALTLTGQAVDEGAGRFGDCIDDANRTHAAHLVRPSLLPPTAAWTLSNAELGSQRYPRDFNAFIFGNFTQMPDTRGAVAAGGTIDLQSFSINQTAQYPTGIIAGQDLHALSGTVAGNIHYGNLLDLSSVDATGTLGQAQVLDFADARRRLVTLSGALAGSPVNGRTIVQPWGGVTFEGSDPVQNVFTVDAGAFDPAYSVQVTVPSQALAIINVSGSTVTIENAGLSLSGADRQRVLWNFPDATSLSITSVGLLGSVLAPKADVTLQSGALDGTIVASSLQGGGELHHAPFTGFDEVRHPTSVTFELPNRLFAGCRYRLEIARSALTSGGACLNEPEHVDFRVALEDLSPLEREALGVRWDPRSGNAVGFRIRDGINTPTAALFARYADAFGLAPGDTLEALSPAIPAGDGSNLDVRFYRQRRSGVPVLGYGLTVHESSGVARAVSGRIASDLSLSTSPAVGQAQASSLAIARVAPSQRPWEDQSSGLVAPAAELAIAAPQAQPAADDFRLIWRVDFTNSGVVGVRGVDVDASTGVIVAVHSAHAEACPDFDRSQVATTQATSLNVATARYGLQTVPATLATDSAGHVGYFLDTKADPIDIVTFTGAPNNLVLICNGDGNFDEPDVITEGTAQWLLRRAAQYLTAQNLAFIGADGGETWRGLDGRNQAKAEVIVSASPDFWADGKPVMAQYLGNPDPLAAASFLFNPAAELGADAIQPFNVGHEVAHAVAAAAVVRAGKPRWIYERETGAITEGFADAVGSMFAREVLGPESSFHCSEQICIRDIQVPDSTGNPDTYLDEDRFYQMPTASCGNNDRCGVHQNSTIVSHWFYLLGRGGTGVNGNGCEFSVAPLSSDENEAWDRALRIAFAAVQLAPDDPDFFAFREATLAAAAAQHTVEVGVASSVQAAWDAVGLVDSLSELAPADKATGVKPWDLELEFHVGQVVPYVVEIAELSDSGDVIGTLPEIDCNTTAATGGGNVTCAPVDLKPGTFYQWRARPASAPDFSACHSPYTFTTSEEAVELTYPATMEEGVAITDWWGGVRLTFQHFEVTQGGSPKARLALTIGEEGACDPEAPSYGFPAPRDQYAQVRDFVGEVDFSRTYYLNALVVDIHGATGKCTTIPLRFYAMDRPEPLAPGVVDHNHVLEPPFLDRGAEDVTFYWTHVDNVVDYTVQIWRRNLDTPGQPVLIPVFDGSVGVNVGPPDGEYEGNETVAYYTFPTSEPFDSAALYVWAVTAIGENGQELSSTAPNSSPGDFDFGVDLGYYVRLPPPELQYPTASIPPVEGQWTHAEWSSVAGAVAYRFRTWIDGAPDQAVEAIVTESKLEDIKEGAAPPQGYCWQVDAMIQGLFAPLPGKPAAERCFHPLPSIIEVLGPADGDSVPLDGFTIRWKSENYPPKYSVGVEFKKEAGPGVTLWNPSPAHAGSGDDVQSIGFPPDEPDFPIDRLTEGFEYGFEVCVVFSDGSRGNCVRRTVTAEPPPPQLSAPEIAFPSRCVPSDGFFIQFTSVAGAEGYEWEIESVVTGNRDQSLGHYAGGVVTASAVEQQGIGSLCPNRTYGVIPTSSLFGDWFRYRVRAVADGETGPWSEWGFWWITTPPVDDPSCAKAEVCGL